MRKRILKEKLAKSLLTKKIEEFYHDESGVYGMITILLSAVIIGYVTFVVDGTGILFDKVRFTQGLQQAGLFLTAEDNRFRENQNIVGVNSQPKLQQVSEDIPPMPAPFTKQPPIFNNKDYAGREGYDAHGWPIWLCPVDSDYEYCKQQYEQISKPKYYQKKGWHAFQKYYTGDYGKSLQDYLDAKGQYDSAVKAHDQAVAAHHSYPAFQDHAKKVGISLDGCSDNDVDSTNYKKCDLAFRQYGRNIQMITNIVRSYYLPTSYKNYTNGNLKNNYNIKDEFYYHCDHTVKNGVVTNDIACIVDGGFERPSWLYWGDTFKKDHKLSFNKTQKISVDNTVYIGKTRANIPVDVVFVNDFSGSMNHSICKDTTCNKKDPANIKITILRNVIQQISNEVLKSPTDPRAPKNYNRIGFVDFAYGAQLLDNPNQCVLPYRYDKYRLSHELVRGNKKDCAYLDKRIQSIKTRLQNYPTYLATPYENELKELQIKQNQECRYKDTYGYKLNYFNTLRMIEDLDGTPLENNLSNTFFRFKKRARCLGQYYQGKRLIDPQPSTTQAWFYANPTDLKNLNSKFASINPTGFTLASSGLIVGANLLMNKNPETAPEKIQSNTKRFIVVLSDGNDEYNAKYDDTKDPDESKFIAGGGQSSTQYKPDEIHFEQKTGNVQDKGDYITRTLMDPTKYLNLGLKPDNEKIKEINDEDADGQVVTRVGIDGICARIRSRLDTYLVDQEKYGRYPSQISFIAIGYDPSKSNRRDQREQYEAWIKCVGHKNYYVAKDKDELINAIRSATGLNEEVGKVTDKRPVFHDK